MSLAILGGTPVRSQPFPPWPDYGRQEETELLRILHSRAWGGYHSSIRELERSFAGMHQVPHAVSCVNGTVALEVALRGVGIGPGDEVIVSPFTFIASASAILLCQGAPVFADIDPQTLNLSAAAAEAAITPRTRAIVVVHFGGHPADMDAFQALAKKYNLAIIEDAAHAHGASWRNIPVGGWGNAGTFSFQAFKLMTAGEGGMIVTRSPELAEFCWSYCNQGRRRDGGWFEHVRLGTNYRMTGFQAAVLNSQLRRLPRQTEVRAANVSYLRGRIRDFPGLKLAKDDPRVAGHPYYLVTLRYDADYFSGVPRDLAIQALQAEGIPVKPTYPYPLYRNPLFRKEGRVLSRYKDLDGSQEYEDLSLVEAERVCRDGIWLSHNVFLGERNDMDDILLAVERLHQQASLLLKAKRATGRGQEPA